MLATAIIVVDLAYFIGYFNFHPSLWGHWKSKRVPKKIYFCFIDYDKAFDCVYHNKLWKILQEMGIPYHLICLLENLNAGQEATFRSGHRTTELFQIGKGVYCHPAYLTYMQSISHEMLDRMKNKLESRLPGEISTTSDMKMIPLWWQISKRN